MDSGENIKNIYKDLPPGVKIVAISKTRSVDEIMGLYSSGHKIFGENKVQELVKKRELLPEDIEWHMVGHLQSNKVKYIAPFISLVHSVDSAKLLKTLNREAIKNSRVIDCLLQVHIAREESKFGLPPEKVPVLLKEFPPDTLPGVRIRGLMGMATFTGNKDVIRNEFRSLAVLFNSVKDVFFSNSSYFNELSMGMSGDYIIAAGEGSTIVRIGTLIFGER